MTGMAALLLVRPIVRHHVRFAQSNERGDGWSAPNSQTVSVAAARHDHVGDAIGISEQVEL